MTNISTPSATPMMLASLVTLGYLAVAMFILLCGHPHEDAYILYIYAEQLASNGSISYFSGAPPAEGATDFLWMLLIAFAAMIGINVAIAAALLNATGMYLLAYLVFAAIDAFRGPALLKAIYLPLLLLYEIPVASVAGFSTAFFGSVSLLLFHGLWRWNARLLCAIPLLAILLGLIRPDGVIIGVCSTIVGFFLVSEDLRKRYLLSAAIAFAIGTGYFIWRWTYFGQLLPLPLYVKSTSNEWLPGLMTNVHWSKVNFVLIVLSLGLLREKSLDARRLLLAATPTLVLLVSLLFAVQSQNVAFRFQAPGSAILLLLSAVALSLLSQRWDGAPNKICGRLRGKALLLCFAAVHLSYHGNIFNSELKYQTSDAYINFFPFHARAVFSEDSSIALTEAGRLAYWVEGRKYDLVGLNTAETAREGASTAYLEGLEPDLIFVYAGNLAQFDCDSGTWCEIPAATFTDRVEASIAGIATADMDTPRTLAGTMAALDYLLQHADSYRLLSVQYDGSYAHFYALKKSGDIDAEGFLAALKFSFESDARASYLDMIKARNGIRN